MKIDVASSDDLARLYTTYIQLVERDVDTTLELELAPGRYGVASIGPINLDLGGNPAPKVPRVDVVLRGRTTQPSAVLHDMAIRVHARSLHVENVILAGRQQGLLDARVARSFSMRNCVVAGNTVGGPWGGVLLRIGGVYGQPPPRVAIEDTWFAGNAEGSASTLLAIAPATGSYVDEVELSRVSLLANGNAVDLRIDEARTIHLDDVLAVKQHAAGVVVRFARCKQVLVEHSTFVVDDPLAIAVEDTSTYRAGCDLRASRIYASGPSHALPACVRGRVDVRPAPPAPARALDDLVAELAAQLPESTSAARARVQEALGISC